MDTIGSNKPCSCTKKQIKQYIGKISGPMLDRIDLQIEVNEVPYRKLQEKKKIETSETIRKRVEKGREIQRKRYENEEFSTNSDLTPNAIKKYCKLDKKRK